MEAVTAVVCDIQECRTAVVCRCQGGWCSGAFWNRLLLVAVAGRARFASESHGTAKVFLWEHTGALKDGFISWSNQAVWARTLSTCSADMPLVFVCVCVCGRGV